MAKSNNNHIRLLELYNYQIYLVLSMPLPASLCKNALLTCVALISNYQTKWKNY